MTLSDAEKQAAKDKANARFRDNTQMRERMRLSGIPKAYQLAKISPSTARLIQQLTSKETLGVVFRGETGRGKTYAACAMLREHLKTKLGRFATMNEILAQVRGAYSSGQNAEEIFSRYRGTPLLVLDDLGKENISADSITKLFELLDARIANQRPTIVTTQFTNNELMQRYSRVNEPETVAAILSRLSQFIPIMFQGEDRRR